MKKWKLSLLTVVFAIVMTACSGKESGSAEPSPTPAQEAEATPEITAQPTVQPTATPVPEEEGIVVTETIQSLFAKYGMKAGTCLSDSMITKKACTQIINEQFNSITFENHLKPDYILDKNESVATGDLVVKFSDKTVELLQWCRENDKALRGHTLIWYSQTPSWIFYENFDTSASLVSRDVMLARMESYIKQIFEELEELGYIDMFYAYDVVNEAWLDDGTKRDCLWMQTIGEDYLWYAFYYADMYAPEYIDLYYNDFNEQFKTDALYEFAQTLVDEDGNYLIDGIGFQAHLYTEDSLEDYFATMDKLATLGLKISLTELDVCLGTWPVIKPGTEENFKVQGQFYYNLINGILERVEAGTVKMDSLTFWGFSDQLSWRKERNPMLYNIVYKPKYAFYGVLQMKEYAGFDE